MFRLTKLVLIFFIFALISAVSFDSVHAAPQATLKLRVEISDARFWNSTFYTKDTDPSKPSVIKAEWSVGTFASHAKTETIVPPKKDSGEISIVTEKGAVVNIQVYVKSAENKNLETWSLQTLNNGQTETITVTMPEAFQPQITKTNL